MEIIRTSKKYLLVLICFIWVIVSLGDISSSFDGITKGSTVISSDFSNPGSEKPQETARMQMEPEILSVCMVVLIPVIRSVKMVQFPMSIRTKTVMKHRKQRPRGEISDPFPNIRS